MMWALYRLCLIRYLRGMIPAAVTLSLMFIAFHRIGLDVFVANVIAFFPVWFFGSMIGSMIFGRNIGWIINLPISKMRLLLTNFLVNLSIFLVTGLTALAVMRFTLEVTDNHQRWLLILSWWNESNADVVRTISGYATVSVGSVVMLLCLGSVNTGYRSRFRMGPGYFTAKRIKILWLVLTGLAGVAFLMREWVYNGLIITVALFALSLFLLVTSVSIGIGLSRNHKRVLVTLSMLLTLAVLGGLAVVGFSHMRNGLPVQAADVIRFLGPFGGATSSETIAKLLEQDIGENDIRDLAKRLKTRLGLKSGFKIDHPGAPDFNKALASKSTAGRIVTLSDVFDLKVLDLAHTRAILARLDVLKGRDSYVWFVFNFVDKRLSKKETETLIRSSNELEMDLGLQLAKYRRDFDLGGEVLVNLDRYSDPRKLGARLTLSVLTGRKWQIKELFERPSSAQVKVVDCTSFNPAVEKDFENAPQDVLNICLREKAMEAAGGPMQRLEEVGWFEPPFSTRQWKIISELWKKKLSGTAINL